MRNDTYVWTTREGKKSKERSKKSKYQGLSGKRIELDISDDRPIHPRLRSIEMDDIHCGILRDTRMFILV